jgi:hypothetical protein
MNSKELIAKEFDTLIDNVKTSLDNVKRFAIGEARKILQVATASLIQTIEKFGSDLEGLEKKTIAMELLSGFYDKIFSAVDIPVVPNILEPIIHKSVKAFLMVLVSATIDALVTTFRETGIFLKKKLDENPYSKEVVKVSYVP